MDADACGSSQGFGGAAVDVAGAANGDAELVLAQAGRDVGMRLGEDVGVYAEGEAGACLRARARWLRSSSSASLSTLKRRMSALRAGRSPGLLADAGEDDAAERLRGRRGERARARRRRRCRSPQPCSASSLRMAREELALTA